jgi:hypothetical protein
MAIHINGGTIIDGLASLYIDFVRPDMRQADKELLLPAARYNVLVLGMDLGSIMVGVNLIVGIAALIFTGSIAVGTLTFGLAGIAIHLLAKNALNTWNMKLANRVDRFAAEFLDSRAHSLHIFGVEVLRRPLEI